MTGFASSFLIFAGMGGFVLTFIAGRHRAGPEKQSKIEEIIPQR
jgi:hypothetical protein